MVSHSKSSANIALCFAAMLVACTTQAQLSTLPKRYRSGNGKVLQQHESRAMEGGFGRRTSLQQRKTSSTKEVRKTNLRKNTRKLSAEKELSMSLSLPLDSRRFDIPSMSMQSSIEELDFSMSIDLVAFDVMSMSMPSLLDVPAETELESISLDNGTSTGSKLVLASVVAGISALVVLAAALFVKSARSRETEEIQEVESNDGPLQQVQMSTSDLSLGSK